LSGHVEFGEYAAETVRREIRQELGQEITDVRLLGVIENLFDSGGQAKHEVVFVLGAAFADDGAYDIGEQFVGDRPAGQVAVRWRPAGATSPPLFPAALAAMIQP
jgi:ADP-ribose pyrophosphatase YjhB (NUDIX family)